MERYLLHFVKHTKQPGAHVMTINLLEIIFIEIVFWHFKIVFNLLVIDKTVFDLAFDFLRKPRIHFIRLLCLMK